jgi:hypothetical protein
MIKTKRQKLLNKEKKSKCGIANCFWSALGDREESWPICCRYDPDPFGGFWSWSGSKSSSISGLTQEKQ